VTHLSWSRLKEAEECRHKVLRKQEKKSNLATDGRIFLPGTVADRCMRAYLELDDPKPGGILDPLDEMLEKHAFHDDQYVIRWRGDPKEDLLRVKSVVKKVLVNLEPILWDLVIPHGYEAELRFGPWAGYGAKASIGVPDWTGETRRLDLVGGIDIVVATLNDKGETDENSEYAIYDLKATENDSYVRGAILAQPIFYAIAIKALFGKYPTKAAFLTPACKEKVVWVDISEDDIRQMHARIEKYCHATWRDEWPTKTKRDSGCDWCEVKHACDLFTMPTGRKISFAEMADRRRAAKK
jgi:hypothetical protein